MEQFEKDGHKIIFGDAIEALKKIPNGTIDLIFIDPPYNIYKDYHGFKFRDKDNLTYEKYTHLWVESIIPILKENASIYVCLDPTRLGTLTEAVSYVFHYPYGCLEQRCSAMIPLLYFSDYIDVFGLESEVSDPRRLIEKEIQDWSTTQKSDGGFPYWKNSSFS